MGSVHAENKPARKKWRFDRWALLGLVLILIGAVLIVSYGMRSFRAYREIDYIRREGLDRGTAGVEDIRPWMSIRFVAVAFAVPEEYLYSALNIPFDQRNADRPLGRLNGDYNRGFVPNTEPPEFVIIQQTREAITAYRANPVVTGLRDVRIWMSMRYIANSTGVPLDYLFAQLGLPADNNADLPLGVLADQQRYQGGPPALEEALRNALAAYQDTR